MTALRRLRLATHAAGAASGFAARALSHLSTLVLMLSAARFLSPADFGAYTLGSLAAALTMLVMYSGVYEQLLRTESPERHAGAGFTVLLGLAVVLAGAHWVLAEPLARLFRSPPLAEILRAFAVLPLIGCVSAWREALYLRDAANLPRYYALLVVRDGSALAVGLLLLWAGGGLHALVVARLWVSLAGMALWQAVVREAPRLDLRAAPLREVAAYGSGVAGSRGLGFAASYGVDLVVGLALNPAALGIYRMSSRLVAGATDIVGQPLSKLGWVRLSAAARAEGGPGALLPAWLRLQRLTLLLAWPALGYLALAAPEIVALLMGPQWSAAATTTTLLAAGAMLRMAALQLEPLLAVHDRGGLLFATRAATTLMGIGLALAALRGGTTAVAVSQVAAAAAALVVTGTAAVRAVALSPRIVGRSLLRPLACLGAVLGLGLALRWASAQWWALGDLAMASAQAALAAAVALATLAHGAKFRPDTTKEDMR
jgi:O-antigen/teichoic acid export membrane protein